MKANTVSVHIYYVYTYYYIILYYIILYYIIICSSICVRVFDMSGGHELRGVFVRAQERGSHRAVRDTWIQDWEA